METIVKVSFICCVWNEINKAPKELDRLITVIKDNYSDKTYEIILIDNNSSDGTKEWMQSLQIECIRKIFNKNNIGKGGSVRIGIDQAVGQFAAIYDLDGEYSPEDSIEGAKVLQKTNASIALGSRILDGRADYIYLENYIGVRLITEYINCLYNERLTDTATGLKALDLSFFKSQRFSFTGFNVDFELVCLALNKNKNVVEYNGKYFPRSKADGKKLKAIKDGISSVIAITYTAFQKQNRTNILNSLLKYLTTKSAARYFSIGIISTCLDLFVFLSIYNYFGISIFTSNLLAFISAISLNYALDITSVFKKNTRFTSKTERALVISSSLTGLIINTVILEIMIGLSVQVFTAKVIAILPTIAWNYFIRRFFIYRKL